MWRMKLEFKTRFSIKKKGVRDVCPVYFICNFKSNHHNWIMFSLRVILISWANSHCNWEVTQQTKHYFFLTYLFVQTVANSHESWQCDICTAIYLCDIITDWYIMPALTASLNTMLYIKWCMPIVVHNHWCKTEMHNKLLTEKISVAPTLKWQRQSSALTLVLGITKEN